MQLVLSVRKVHKAQLAETVSRALWGSLVPLALWAPLEKMETRLEEFGEAPTLSWTPAWPSLAHVCRSELGGVLSNQGTQALWGSGDREPVLSIRCSLR